MANRTMNASKRRQFVARSTMASARLERRVVPEGYVRPAEIEKFVESLRAKR